MSPVCESLDPRGIKPLGGQPAHGTIQTQQQGRIF